MFAENSNSKTDASQTTNKEKEREREKEREILNQHLLNNVPGGQHRNWNMKSRKTKDEEINIRADCALPAEQVFVKGTQTSKTHSCTQG